VPKFRATFDQLIARNMALLELNAKLERLSLRLELKNKRLWPLRTGLLFRRSRRASSRVNPPCRIRRSISHFLFGGLPRDLQQQRFGDNPAPRTSCAGCLEYYEGKCLRNDERARPIFRATSSWVYSNCVAKRCKPSASSNAVKSFR